MPDTVPTDPYIFFDDWFTEAKAADFYLPNAMCLATADANCRPSLRMVLLKSIDKTGVTFFTNYESRKAEDLFVNPYAAATLWWDRLERQVRFEGAVEKTSEKVSDDYFATRPRGSQLSAAASAQSKELESSQGLQRKIQRLDEQYADQPVPRPDFWGGYLLKPEKIEFWQGRPNRCHDRWFYTRNTGSDWTVTLLNP